MVHHLLMQSKMKNIPKKTTIIIGEGPTEFFYFNSLKDDYKGLASTISPACPKHTSIPELKKKIEESINRGYEKIYCVIDMDNKHDVKSKTEYEKLKNAYNNKVKKNRYTNTKSEIRFFETERCTELFFYFYFKYTTMKFHNYEQVSQKLNSVCFYEKKIEFFRKHPLHPYFKQNGGSLNAAINNAIKSIGDRKTDDKDYTYSELGEMFKELGI